MDQQPSASRIPCLSTGRHTRDTRFRSQNPSCRGPQHEPAQPTSRSSTHTGCGHDSAATARHVRRQWLTSCSNVNSTSGRSKFRSGTFCRIALFRQYQRKLRFRLHLHQLHHIRKARLPPIVEPAPARHAVKIRCHSVRGSAPNSAQVSRTGASTRPEILKSHSPHQMLARCHSAARPLQRQRLPGGSRPRPALSSPAPSGPHIFQQCISVPTIRYFSLVKSLRFQ